jgi:hypothetical protein
MHLKTKQKQILSSAGAARQTQEFITLGTVVDTNDPQQMGRVRAVCPAWGDTFETVVEDLPWCIYVAPFGGQMQTGFRGPANTETAGGVAYGIWAIPKVGAQVIVACLDGDPSIRVYMGCVYDQLTPHTMPHGRWMYDDHDALPAEDTVVPRGPYSSRELPIEPLSANIKQAFGQNNARRFERQTRAADYSVAGVGVESLDFTASAVQDDKNITADGWTSTQGYAVSRGDPDGKSTLTDRNYDSQVYTFTSPGFHSLSMDDRPENCRVRLRTTAGHQILMDDTNERIYIQTAKGNSWVELDQNGNIDIFTANKVNVRAAKDINFTSDETIRFSARRGIHMYSDDEIRMHSLKDVNILSEQNLRVHSLQSTFFQADQDVHLTAGASYFLSVAADLHEKCGSNFHISSGATTHINAGASLLTTAPEIHLNGPSAAVAQNAQAPSEQRAFLTNRVPDHEPWARTMTANDFSHEPEFSYDSDQVNRSERGTTTDRGEFWRR